MRILLMQTSESAYTELLRRRPSATVLRKIYGVLKEKPEGLVVARVASDLNYRLDGNLVRVSAHHGVSFKTNRWKPGTALVVRDTPDGLLITAP